MPGEYVRAFIALEIENKAKDTIEDIKKKIQETNYLNGRWILRENIHLTLKFLGDTQKQKIEPIKEIIEKALNQIHIINCSLNQIGVFPSPKSPRIIWVGVEKKADAVMELADKIENSLLKLHFKKEKRLFEPHITICRIKQILSYPGFISTIQNINNNFTPVDFSISKIILFESELTSKGPIYKPMSTFRLNSYH